MKIKEIGEMEISEECPLGTRTKHSSFIMILLFGTFLLLSAGFGWACWEWGVPSTFDPTSVFDLLVVIFYISSILMTLMLLLVVVMVRKRQCKKGEIKKK